MELHNIISVVNVNLINETHCLKDRASRYKAYIKVAIEPNVVVPLASVKSPLSGFLKVNHLAVKCCALRKEENQS